jgi:ATP-dependent Clp protease ATP-binding subunit ClpC
MSAGFERFSEGARRILTRAQEEAKRLGHGHIDTEHILLGILADESGVAAKVLVNLGTSLNKVQAAVEFVVGKGGRQTPGEVNLAPGVSIPAI